MREYVITAYRVTGEMTYITKANSRLEAEHAAKSYFSKKKRGWKKSFVDRLYRVEEGGENEASD